MYYKPEGLDSFGYYSATEADGLNKLAYLEDISQNSKIHEEGSSQII
jgi:hypothetical protein